MKIDAIQPEPLVDRLRRQDHAAFAELVRENEPLIAGLCQTMGLRGADLEDALAEAFAEVYRSLPRFAGQSAPGTWVYRIACRVIWRTGRRRARAAHSGLGERDVVSDQAGVPEQVERAQQQRRVWAAVAQLEPKQATVVELYYRCNCSTEEIALRVGYPAGTVKTLLHRARAALRQKLQGEMQ